MCVSVQVCVCVTVFMSVRVCECVHMCVCVCTPVQGAGASGVGVRRAAHPQRGAVPPRGCSQVCVCRAGCVQPVSLPACVYMCVGCALRRALGGGCGSARAALWMRVTGCSCVCTLAVRCGACVWAACPTRVDVPWTLAGCTRAACPRRVGAAPGDGVRGTQGELGPWGLWGLPAGPWCLLQLVPWLLLGSGTPSPSRQHRSERAMLLRVSGAEETGTGLGSVGLGMAGKGSRTPEPGPPVPAPRGAEVPELRARHIPALPRVLTVSVLPSARGAQQARGAWGSTPCVLQPPGQAACGCRQALALRGGAGP